MNRLIALTLGFWSLAAGAQNQVDFSNYFEDCTLRIDYFHTGDAKTEDLSIDKIYKQGVWAGNPENCVQPFELGPYKVTVYDSATRQLIFSKGYSSIFAEYQTTDPAIKGVKRTYHESVLIPFPKRTFLLAIEKRDRYNKLSRVFEREIDPLDYHIVTERFDKKEQVVIPAVSNGTPHTTVDLVILAEGYRADELEIFKNDLKYYTSLFFKVEPYKSHAEKFNIHGIFSPSEESGTDEPRQGIYKNTKLSTSFNMFDLDRYCLAEDNKSIRDMAAAVPYDAILIMVNRNRYGGGGIYNWQTVFNTGSPMRDYVFLHEFAHAFAGLADEYFSSPVAYVDFYTPGVEPLEANITALTDPAHVKWQKYLSPGIQVPTEWGKATYDSLVTRISTLSSERELAVAKLKDSGATAAVIEKTQMEYQSEISRVNSEINDFYKNHPLKDKIGVFEGANYMSKGMYRPTLMSLMHKFEEGNPSYDLVNEEAILSTIHYYTGE